MRVLLEARIRTYVDIFFVLPFTYTYTTHSITHVHTFHPTLLRTYTPCTNDAPLPPCSGAGETGSTPFCFCCCCCWEDGGTSCWSLLQLLLLLLAALSMGRAVLEAETRAEEEEEGGWR